jgi:hypothetical protein
MYLLRPVTRVQKLNRITGRYRACETFTVKYNHVLLNRLQLVIIEIVATVENTVFTMRFQYIRIVIRSIIQYGLRGERE